MVVVGIEVEGEKKGLYMDGTLHRQLTTNVIPKVQKKDFDYMMVIDGEEGSGKSVFAQQVAKILDPNFGIENIAFTHTEFTECIKKAKPHSCIIFDEAFVGLSSRASLSEINQLLVSQMMQMRQLNLFVIIVMPTYFMLEKYVVLHRAKCLFHIYLGQKGDRGYWCLYNKQRMKWLYDKGKKMYEYKYTKPVIWGHFNDGYMVNEEEYRKRKRKALQKSKKNTRADTYKMQRDTLLYILSEDLKFKQSDVLRLCKKHDYNLKRSILSVIVNDKKEKIMNGEV